MKEGFWRVEYGSQFGPGFGILVFETGTVVGADVLGGIWDGTFKFNPRSEMLDVQLTVTFPPEVMSTVSGSSSSGGFQESYEFSLPRELDRQQIIPITIQGQPMEVRFTKIRDFPIT